MCRERFRPFTPSRAGHDAICVGAAGGQGTAEAIALVREGATVIATDLHDEDPKLGGGIAYRRLDVAEPEDADDCLGGSKPYADRPAGVAGLSRSRGRR